MARTDIAVTSLDRTGPALVEVAGDSVNNHSFTNDADTRAFIHARNADAVATHSITLLIATTVDGQSVASKVVTVAISATQLIGPFPPVYTQADGKVYFNVDSAQLKLAVFHLAAQ